MQPRAAKTKLLISRTASDRWTQHGTEVATPSMQRLHFLFGAVIFDFEATTRM